jgi:hypothetical protein
MVMREASPFRGAPKNFKGPDLKRDLSPDDASDSLHVNLHLAEIQAEMARLKATERREVSRIELTKDISKSTMSIVYFGSRTPTDRAPIVFVPGLGGFKSLMEAVAESSAEMGRDAVIYSPPRKQERRKVYHPRNFFNPMRFQQQGLVKVMQAVHESPEVTEFRDGDAADEYDGAGWSMGNRIVTGTASFLLRKPRGKGIAIRNVQSVAGAGNTGVSGVPQLINHGGAVGGLLERDIVGGVPLMMENVQDRQTFIADAKDHFLPAPDRFLYETAYIAFRPQVDDFVADIHAAEGHHLYAANMYSGDSLFPPGDTLDHANDMFDFYSVEDGEHTKLATYPQDAALGIVALSNVMANYGQMYQAVRSSARAQM